MATLSERVSERFPGLVSLLGQPEIGSLLTRAVTENWSPTRFQSAFIASHWFRTQSESQRRWWVTSATDPEQAREQRRSTRAAFGSLARQLGANLSTNQVNYLSELILSHGQDPNGPEARAAIASLAKLTPVDRYHYGAFQTVTKQIEALSESQFFMPISNIDASKYGRKVIQGVMTIDDVQSAMQQLAVKRYPHLRELLIEGQTPAQIVAPYRELVANELELGNPDRVDVKRNPIWRQLLGIRDPKSHKVRLPTESEVLKLARSQPQWWKTANGRKTDAGLATSLLETFGMRAS